jgi:hypothetical protein
MASRLAQDSRRSKFAGNGRKMVVAMYLCLSLLAGCINKPPAPVTTTPPELSPTLVASPTVGLIRVYVSGAANSPGV